jgi:hypothetical protein
MSTNFEIKKQLFNSIVSRMFHTTHASFSFHTTDIDLGIRSQKCRQRALQEWHTKELYEEYRATPEDLE